MAFKVGDLVKYQNKTRIVIGSRITESSVKYLLTSEIGEVDQYELSFTMNGNEGSILQARNMIFGDQIVKKKPDANPPLVEEVAAEVPSTTR